MKINIPLPVSPDTPMTTCVNLREAAGYVNVTLPRYRIASPAAHTFIRRPRQEQGSSYKKSPIAFESFFKTWAIISTRLDTCPAADAQAIKPVPGWWPPVCPSDSLCPATGCRNNRIKYCK